MYFYNNISEPHKSVCTTGQNSKPLKMPENTPDFENLLT